MTAYSWQVLKILRQGIATSVRKKSSLFRVLHFGLTPEIRVMDEPLPSGPSVRLHGGPVPEHGAAAVRPAEAVFS